MEADIQSKIKEIKRSFRLAMNGVASQSMRMKGIEYRVNWGVALPTLKQMAKEIGQDKELALALWKENVRECKIMATLLMPAGEISQGQLEDWASSIDSYELAELSSFNLFQHIPFVGGYAYNWIASDNKFIKLCGYHVLSRLFSDDYVMAECDREKFSDNLRDGLADENMIIKKAAFSCSMKFADMCEENERLIKNLYNEFKIELF